jgi:hypothetical protein
MRAWGGGGKNCLFYWPRRATRIEVEASVFHWGTCKFSLGVYFEGVGETVEVGLTKCSSSVGGVAKGIPGEPGGGRHPGGPGLEQRHQ